MPRGRPKGSGKRPKYWKIGQGFLVGFPCPKILEWKGELKMTNEEEVFEVNGSTSEPVSNILEKGRYKFTVNNITNYTSQAKNKCA